MAKWIRVLEYSGSEDFIEQWKRPENRIVKENRPFTDGAGNMIRDLGPILQGKEFIHPNEGV